MPKRTDVNHKTIINAFKKLGFSVKDLSAVGEGFPDLLIALRGNNYLIEVKSEKGKLNDRQKKFIDTWNSPVYVIHSTDEVIEFYNQMTANEKT